MEIWRLATCGHGLHRSSLVKFSPMYFFSFVFHYFDHLHSNLELHIFCYRYNKSSAAAEMGDRGHNRHGPKMGGCCAPFAGDGPRLVQCVLGRGVLPYQAASSSIQPLGHNGPKIAWGGCALFSGVARSTSNTMSRRPRSTFVPSGILIHRAVWPQ